jgi:putative nucleotidyltransferase with HDIG domain
MPNRIATVHQAVVVIGLQALYEVILAASLGSFLNRPLPGYELRKGDLWRHSLGVAICARMIAEKRKWKNVEEFYFAGLLSDIGKLALEKMLRALAFSIDDWRSASFLEIERSYFGIDHAMLGAEMARRWRLPEGLVAVIANHHNPELAGPHRSQAYAVHIGDSVMMMLGVGIGRDGLQYGLDARALEVLNMSDTELEELYNSVMSQIEMAELLIDLPVRS